MRINIQNKEYISLEGVRKGKEWIFTELRPARTVKCDGSSVQLKVGRKRMMGTQGKKRKKDSSD